jgi:hypothetical protein
MTKDEIRAIALEVAKKMYGGESSDMPEILVDFAARFLAALSEKAEPVACLKRDCIEFRKGMNDELFKQSLTDRGLDVFLHPAPEPVKMDAFAQEVKDADELLRLLNLPPDSYRTDGGYINMPKVKAAVHEPWDYPTIEPVNPPVPPAVGAAKNQK